MDLLKTIEKSDISTEELVALKVEHHSNQVQLRIKIVRKMD